MKKGWMVLCGLILGFQPGVGVYSGVHRSGYMDL